ncbi:MAG: Mrp/NBP35 family ATP-binding protein [Bdellovibrionota bacterium]
MANPNPFDQQKPIPNVKHVIAISSGKGGVGKSTVTSHLALALAQKGAKVGLLDADIYGPSIPRIFGILNQTPPVNSSNKLEPIERYNVKIMSMGLLVEDNQALIWRGPMLFKALEQLLRDVNWGELDYLLVDLPPGTGDVQLTLCQKIPMSAAITVTTPQNIALIDVTRSIDMFKKLNVPMFGLIENMSYFLAPSGERMSLFPKGELDKYIKENEIPKLAEIPFTQNTAMGCEIGIPIVQSKPDSLEGNIFGELAEKILRKFV